jgi:hypothetical protein
MSSMVMGEIVLKMAINAKGIRVRPDRVGRRA